jgi:RNA polymerase sigma factor (sigma-70 family)
VVAGEKYVKLRQKLAWVLIHKGSHHPEEHADKAINKVCSKLEEGEEITNLEGYFIGVAKKVYLDSLKGPESRHQSLDDLPPSAEPFVESFRESRVDEHRLSLLNLCLGQLEREERELVIQYYDEDKSAKIALRKELAARLGIPVNTLRMRALRIREKLEQCVRRRLSQAKM